MDALKKLPSKDVVSNDANLNTLISFAKSAHSAKSPEKLLELENFLRGLFYGLDSGLTDDDKAKLVEQVVLPLTTDASWSDFYEQAKKPSGTNDSYPRPTPSSATADSSLIGIIPYIVEDYKYLREGS
ncbi:hypothetical protein CVT24_004873 [Panaeolus cyanescens]|uniref:Uncharacterized protein n=1 Tax=Panaeolus cyanescens TaxID=181874 RepID=A0A409V9W5_9AGAR|nr:hypothetical protein CVT24_004873 [Panaeolus cyanescens]